MKITCYTDGSCKPSKKLGGIGVIWIENDKIINEYSKGFKNTTNNQMELLAIYVALVGIKKPIEKLTIVSDSEYAIGCISNSSWNPKKNIELINKIKCQLTNTQKLVSDKIEFIHVYGHQAGEYYNNYVDKLAQNAAEYQLID